MKVKVGALWGQVVIKTEDLPGSLIEGLRAILDIPLGGGTLLVGEHGSGAELFLALCMAKDAGVDVRFKNESDAHQIFTARTLLYHGLKGSNGFDGIQALVRRDNKLCRATWTNLTFLVGTLLEVEAILFQTGRDGSHTVVAAGDYNGTGYVLLEAC